MKRRSRPAQFSLAILLAIATLVGLSPPSHTAPTAKPAAQQLTANKRPAEKTIDAYTIKQAPKVYGEQLTTVSAIGIKTANARSNITMVATPPFKTVTIFNTHSKTYFQGPAQEFRNPLQKTAAMFNNWTLTEIPMEKAGTGTLYGMKVTKYRSPESYRLKQLELRKNNQTPGGNPSVVDSQSTDDFHLPNAAGLALCKFFSIPPVPGIPLAVDFKDMDGDPKNFLTSTRAVKTKVSTEDFVMPGGYRRLKTIEELSQSDDTQDAIQLFGGP